MGVENLLPSHVIVHRRESSIWETKSIVRGSLKPQLEVSFQNPDMKAIPTKNLYGLLHKVNLQFLELGSSGCGQNVNLLKVDHHCASTRIP